MKRSSNAGVPFILVTLLLDTLGVGLIIPVGPTLVASLPPLRDLPPDARSGAAAIWFGIIFALYSTMQFICAPVLGGLSDRFGRRAVILPSLVGAAASYLISAWAPHLGWLFLGRTISGITGASFSAATAYIADITPPEKRAQNFGLVGAAFGLGFIVGPSVGGLVGAHDPRTPYLVAACLNAVNFLYGALVLPESLRSENRRAFSFARANPFGALRNLGRHPFLLGLTGTLVCAYLAQMMLQTGWQIVNKFRFQWDDAQVGFSLSMMGVAGAVVQGGLIRVLIPRLGERRILLIGLMMSIGSTIAFGLATHGWMLYALIFPYALSGVAGPAVQSLLSREVGPNEQGELQGSLTSLSSLTAIVGPVIGTSLFAHFSQHDAHPYLPGAPFVASGLLNIVGILLAARLFARVPATAHAQAPAEAPAPDPG